MTFLVMLSVLFCLLMPLYIVYWPPNWVFALFEARFPTVIFRQTNATARHIALTIDDAPSSHTLAILDTLDRHQATATFFIIGQQVAGNEDILEEIVWRGHELGNHAWADEPSRSLSQEELERQLKEVDGLLLSVYRKFDMVEQMPRFFRPGSGFFSRTMLEVVERTGHRLALGNIYPHDPQIPFSWLNARHIVRMARPGGIIICHDRRAWTLPMLETVLPRLTKKGYTVSRLSDLMSI